MINNIWAALMFFTRFPLWKIRKVPSDCFKHIINYWPLAGWLTGGITALVLWLLGHVCSMPVAVIVAFACRLLLTGALHEDGLADFIDGFGGGNDRESTLRIMKDSRIGSYGVIGLVIYYGCLFATISSLQLSLACAVIVSGDAFCKGISSQIVNMLPYARVEEESKAKVIYDRMDLSSYIVSILFAIIPFALFLSFSYWRVVIFPAIVFFALIILMKKRLQGYTGDCCGATFLLCELSFYIGIQIICKLDMMI